ncbi:MAG: hypothetical protein KAX51_00275 [Chromatiaceae bacterium]|nr:hypothetical protein [Chromatiaceae bacterium]MBP6806711.1 hypothetical protein [Chromatiaceae bacterium]MBP8284025.1 hypothetical protein [Chromatiaceae bacterium]MBP8288261.1 hypothetical protein [Chromatiaceae bacterium]MBP9603018.1 hypothetical protein [Chromatiaceae bacterium]
MWELDRDPLLGRRFILTIFDAKQEMSARRVSKGDAVFRQLIPIRGFAGDDAQGFLVEELSFKAQVTVLPGDGAAMVARQFLQTMAVF